MKSLETDEFLSLVKYDASGLIPVIAQSSKDNSILMLAYMNADSLRITLEKKMACYWSRSRESLWLKGETSGHFQFIDEIFLDCDGDTILLKVNQVGPACHTGEMNCFFSKLNIPQ